MDDSYHLIPPILRDSIREVATTQGRDNFGEFERSFGFALTAVQDVAEELKQALWRCRNSVMVGSRFSRVRFANLVSSNIRRAETQNKLVKGILKSSDVPPLGEVTSPSVQSNGVQSAQPRCEIQPPEEDESYLPGRLSPDLTVHQIDLGDVSEQFCFGGCFGKCEYHGESDSELPVVVKTRVPREVLELRDQSDDVTEGQLGVPHTVAPAGELVEVHDIVSPATELGDVPHTVSPAVELVDVPHTVSPATELSDVPHTVSPADELVDVPHIVSPTTELVIYTRAQQEEAIAARSLQGAAAVSSTTPVEIVKIFFADDGGSGALNVISKRVGSHDRYMKVPSSTSRHRLPETKVWWMERRHRGLVEVLGDREFRDIWINWEADVTMLHFGQWDILRNRLGARKPLDFVNDVIFHINLFKDQAKEYIDQARWGEYDQRMKTHLFVLVAPKRDEVRHDFMPSAKYSTVRREIITALKVNTSRLYREAGVVVATASESYQLKLHCYLARLICKECRPTTDELLDYLDIRWGGCDQHLSSKWNKI